MLLLFSFPIFSQTESQDCRILLKKAQHDFEIGKIDRAKERISGCLDRSITEALQKEILDLFIEISLFSDDKANAEEYYLDLKKIDPFYRLNKLVPEMRYLAGRFETYPSTTYSFFASVFFYSRPFDLEASPIGTTVQNLDFSRERGDPLGWFIGGNAEFNLNNSDWDASIGYAFVQQGYHYTADVKQALYDETMEIRSDAELTFREQQHRSQFNLGLIYQFNKKNRFDRRFSPFVQVRVGINILHPKSAKIHEPIIHFPAFDDSKKDAAIVLTDIRQPVNFSIQGSTGIRFRVIDRLFFQTGITYQRMLGNFVNADAENLVYKELRDNFNFQDDNFNLHHLGIFFGGGYYFFKTRRKR